MTKRTWTQLWRDLTAPPEFYRERRGNPQELAMAVAAPVLSVVLATTLAAGIAAFFVALFPSWVLTGLVPLSAVAATVGYVYAQRLQWSGVIVREWLVLLGPLVVLWRLLSLFTLGQPLGATLRAWLAHPGAVFDGPFVAGTAVLALSWTQGMGYGRDLAALAPPSMPSEPPPEPGSPRYWTSDEQRRVLYAPMPANLIARWLQGGLLLAVLSALGAAGVRQTLSGPGLLRLVTLAAPDESSALPNVLAYMLCGLVLVGLAQLSRLRTNWTLDGVAVMPGLPRRALLGLAALLALSLAVAFALPTRYALGLGDLLDEALGVVTYIVYTIMTALEGLLAILLWPLSLLLGRHTRSFHPAPPPKIPPLAHAPHGGGNALGSLFFWLVALAVVGYCAYALFVRAKGRVPALGMIGRLAARALAALGRLARLLLGLAERGAAGVARVVRELTSTGGRAVGPRVRHPSWRRMGPRERVAYLYLSVEERARRLGLPRRSGQTASDYSRRLRQEMPDLDPDLSGLTDLFLEARYSPHPFDDERAGGARLLWQRVRARLRARRR